MDLGLGAVADGSQDVLPAGPDIAVNAHDGNITLCDSLAKGRLRDREGRRAYGS